MVVNGTVYVARMHNEAWNLAGRCPLSQIQRYGQAVIDKSGKVIDFVLEQ
jgi:hypothetical protein